MECRRCVDVEGTCMKLHTIVKGSCCKFQFWSKPEYNRFFWWCFEGTYIKCILTLKVFVAKFDFGQNKNTEYNQLCVNVLMGHIWDCILSWKVLVAKFYLGRTERLPVWFRAKKAKANLKHKRAKQQTNSIHIDFNSQFREC